MEFLPVREVNSVKEGAFVKNVDLFIEKLKYEMTHKKKSEQYEQILFMASMYSDICYLYNQFYTDKDIETLLLEIKDNILENSRYKPNSNVVLFYDGFGLDLRGWAVSYVKALSKLGYYVVYVAPSQSENNIPHIISELNPSSSCVIYIDHDITFVDRAGKINSLFSKYAPGTAFFYTTPNDVSAAIAFSNNPATTRIQVDLTDHAFWIGVNSFDIILECREMGASIAHFYRGIPLNKIQKLDCAPYINIAESYEPLPLDIEKEKYIFTGGALYKTLGDTELLYYKTIRHILENFVDIKFLYAGEGDCSELNKLQAEYPGRVFYVHERPDFFRILCNCTLYINSYPMFGGLMMRYAALAGKIPVTLKHNNDSDGLLINQEKLGVEFEDYDDYISEIDLLLSNEAYRTQKEKCMKNTVIDEETFNKNLDKLIKEHKTEFFFNKIRKYDTSEFRAEYKKRFSEKTICELIANKKSLFLFAYFPIKYLKGVMYKIARKINK